MSNTVIQLKHSTETGNVPSGLVNGEIAINTFDGKLFYRDPSGVTQSIQNFPGPSGLDGEIQFNDSGDLGASSNLTFNKTTGNLSSYTLHTRSYVQFPDGTKQYTANAGGGGGESITITVGLLPPASGNTVGDVWIDSNTGIEFTWINDGDSSQWIELGPVNINVEGGGSSGSINVVFDHANAAFNKANSANSLAQAAFDAANNAGSSGDVQVIFAHANGAFDRANSANVLSQSSFDKANSANVLAQAAFDAANNAGSSAEIQTIFTHANGAFDKANSANNLAQSAYNYANTISLVGYATETYVNNTVANLVNSAPTTLDTLNELAAALGNDANFSTTVTNLIGNAYNQANSANVLAQSGFDKANSANNLAQASFDKANAAYDLANISITYDTNPPASGNTVGDRWIDSNTAIEYTWIDDGDSGQWIEIGPTNIAVSSGGGNVDFTAVSSNVVPSANVTYDLGSPTKRWRDIYLSGNTIDLGGAQLKSDANSGALLIIPSPTAETPNPKATLVSPSGSITAIETSNGTVNVATIETVSSGTSDAFFLNSNTVSSNVTIPSGKNAISGGPITIAANVVVTISPGSEWTVV